ncbi:MAG TPA: DUF4401 domain-containing protein [Dongiaceae bacterium]
MTTLAAFCARTGIDEATARQALSRGAIQDDAPWYMQAVLGIGAWITAIAGLFFAWAVLDLGFGLDEPNSAVAIIGAVLFAASLWLLQRRPEGAFSAHIAVAFATAGTLLAAAGIGIPEESLWQAAAATLPFAAAAIWQQRSVLLQFVVVSVTLILCILSAWDHWDRVIADLPAIFTPIGAALLLYPPRRDVRPAALALLIVPQLTEIVAFDFEHGWMLWSGWPAKLLLLATFAFIFVANWRRAVSSQTRPLAIAGAVAATAIALLLPTGASAGLVLLVLAYTLGSRALAVLGTLAEIYFIWRFYDDFQSTLLTKSIIMMAAGSILLICYGLLIAAAHRRRQA